MKAPHPAVPRAFATMVEGTAAPYGYTITIWSGGALLMHYRSAPRVWEVFLFAVGAVLGFTFLGAVGSPVIKRVKPLPGGSARAWAGMLDWFAIGLAVGAVALIAQIASWVAWPLGAFAGTLLYLAVASLQLALAAAGESES